MKKEEFDEQLAELITTYVSDKDTLLDAMYTLGLKFSGAMDVAAQAKDDDTLSFCIVRNPSEKTFSYACIKADVAEVFKKLEDPANVELSAQIRDLQTRSPEARASEILAKLFVSMSH